MTTKREELLTLAHEAVMRSRPEIYGQPLQLFDPLADMLNSMGFCRTNGEPIRPADCAIILIVLKLARAINDPKYVDNWVDIAGYAACGYEVS